MLATVNGVPVRAAEVEPYLWDWRGFEALQDVVSYRLVEQAATSNAVTVSSEETQQAVDKEIVEIKKTAPQNRALDEILREQGYPKSRLYMRVRSELIVNKIVLKTLKPAELVKVSTIIFHPASEQTPALSAAISRADKAYEKLHNGAAWNVIVAEGDNDARAQQSKGLLGWRKISAFPASVSAELANLKIGGITKPAQTQNGIQIFKLEARGADATGQNLEEMRAFFLSVNGPAVLNKIRGDAKIVRLYP